MFSSSSSSFLRQQGKIHMRRSLNSLNIFSYNSNNNNNNNNINKIGGSIRSYYKVPITDMKFCMNEVHGFPQHYEKLSNESSNDEMDASPEMVDMILEEMSKFAENDLFPLQEIGDTIGCTYINEYEVTTPPGFKEVYQSYTDGGWQGLNFPEKYGGQGLPMSLTLFKTEILATANFGWFMYPGLSKGCINTLLNHATDELKDKYLPSLISGEWTGTMCLTEPQCGSDLNLVTTKAVPVEGKENVYKITGTKIFISCGEHDMTDNIIHCVLARLPDAPEGTKGLSLFLVPKKIVNDDGQSTDMNFVKIGRIEDKMGCHSSSTCEINFEESEGYLIGEKNKGLNHMFTFINTSRIGTAIQGVSTSELSYQNSSIYAKERLAMRSLSGVKMPDVKADAIIYHPDVRKMLLTQRCFAEGGRSMIYECAKLADEMEQAKANGDDKLMKEIDDKMGFLTPILKGFLTEKGCEAASLGIQCWGGHGYIKQNNQERIYRDVRISALWEGTTGIQALDLLGRKIMLHGKLKPINDKCQQLYKYSSGLLFKNGGKIGSHARTLMQKTLEWHILTYRIALQAKSNPDAIGIASNDYLLYSGYISLAYHWLQMEEAAVKLNADKDSSNYDKEFIESKIQVADFYFENILPRTDALKKTMLAPVSSVMSMKNDNF